MAITSKSTKILWANSAGRCAFPDCREKLCTDDAGEAAPHTIGEMAHICGEKVGSNRHDPSQTPAERDDYANLVLLCPTHHTRIDKPENEGTYTVAVLHEMKTEHENFVSGRLEKHPFADKHSVAAYFYPLMKENHEIFMQYGPYSEIARKNPESDAHGVWLSERLATIIPNNRRMADIAQSNLNLFSLKEKMILIRFVRHVASYDRWVRDEITYEGVTRFPIEFEALIEELADGRA